MLLTITAHDAVTPRDAPLPVFTATYFGSVNGDTPERLAVPVLLITPPNASSPFELSN